jgi:maleylacetoacetate isomerase
METVLYNFWLSSASWRVRIILNLKNIPYQYHPIDLLEGKHANSEHQTRNAMQQVPTLLIDGKYFSQSLAIIRYLELTRPQVSVVPADPYLQARMWEISEIINAGIQPLQNLPVQNKIAQLGGDKKEWLREVVNKGLSSVEAILAETAGEFAIGDVPSVADACIVPQLYSAKRFAVPLASYPLLSRIDESARKHAAFIKAEAVNQPDSKQKPS